MPRIPITMPQMGESIAEAVIVKFLASPGDLVQADQELMEVETNKATTHVVSPCRGHLGSWEVKENESYPVGEILSFVDASEEDARKLGLDTPTPSPSSSATPEKPAVEYVYAEPQQKKKVEPRVRGLPVPVHISGASYLSPRLKARIHDLGLHAADLAGVAGSGAGGRVTIEDFERYIAHLENQKLTKASSMRVAVADAMRRSWTRPIATVGLPICMDPLLAHRKKLDSKPGPTLYALRALAIALAENSAPAGRLVGSKIVHPPAIDVGFAVEADDGVLVPVIREADKKALDELQFIYNHLLTLARQRNLPPEATGGSIATVTNYGTFGLTWATPIPLPEQTLVLGLGVGSKAPQWDEAKGQFVPITQANLTLSFDHRVLDGGAAGRLLTRIAALMNAPEQL